MTDDNKVLVAAYIEKEVDMYIRLAAAKQRLNKSQFLRQAIEHYLEHLKNEHNQ